MSKRLYAALSLIQPSEKTPFCAYAELERAAVEPVEGLPTFACRATTGAWSATPLTASA